MFSLFIRITLLERKLSCFQVDKFRLSRLLDIVCIKRASILISSFFNQSFRNNAIAFIHAQASRSLTSLTYRYFDEYFDELFIRTKYSTNIIENYTTTIYINFSIACMRAIVKQNFIIHIDIQKMTL